MRSLAASVTASLVLCVLAGLWLASARARQRLWLWALPPPPNPLRPRLGFLRPLNLSMTGNTRVAHNMPPDFIFIPPFTEKPLKKHAVFTMLPTSPIIPSKTSFSMTEMAALLQTHAFLHDPKTKIPDSQDVEFVVLITPLTSETINEALLLLGARLLRVPPLTPHNLPGAESRMFAVGNRFKMGPGGPDEFAFTKLHLWRLEGVFESIIYLDLDMFFFSVHVSAELHRLIETADKKAGDYFFAAPRSWQNGCCGMINPALMVFSPSRRHFEGLLAIATTDDYFAYESQTLYSRYHVERKGVWIELPQKYATEKFSMRSEAVREEAVGFRQRFWDAQDEEYGGEIAASTEDIYRFDLWQNAMIGLRKLQLFYRARSSVDNEKSAALPIVPPVPREYYRWRWLVKSAVAFQNIGVVSMGKSDAPATTRQREFARFNGQAIHWNIEDSKQPSILVDIILNAHEYIMWFDWVIIMHEDAHIVDTHADIYGLMEAAHETGKPLVMFDDCPSRSGAVLLHKSMMGKVIQLQHQYVMWNQRETSPEDVWSQFLISAQDQTALLSKGAIGLYSFWEDSCERFFPTAAGVMPFPDGGGSFAAASMRRTSRIAALVVVLMTCMIVLSTALHSKRSNATAAPPLSSPELRGPSAESRILEQLGFEMVPSVDARPLQKRAVMTLLTSANKQNIIDFYDLAIMLQAYLFVHDKKIRLGDGRDTEFVVMITPAVPQYLRDVLLQLGSRLLIVPPITVNEGPMYTVHNHMFTGPGSQYEFVYTKLQIWKLEKIYEVVLFVDGDLFFLTESPVWAMWELFDDDRTAKNVSFMTALERRDYHFFAAAREWMDCCGSLNSGLFMVTPSQVHFDFLMALAPIPEYKTYCEQALLGKYYMEDKPTLFTEIPRKYNTIHLFERTQQEKLNAIGLHSKFWDEKKEYGPIYRFDLWQQAMVGLRKTQLSFREDEFDIASINALPIAPPVPETYTDWRFTVEGGRMFDMIAVVTIGNLESAGAKNHREYASKSLQAAHYAGDDFSAGLFTKDVSKIPKYDWVFVLLENTRFADNAPPQLHALVGEVFSTLSGKSVILFNDCVDGSKGSASILLKLDRRSVGQVNGEMVQHQNQSGALFRELMLLRKRVHTTDELWKLFLNRVDSSNVGIFRTSPIYSYPQGACASTLWKTDST
ncbi:hypothetical protein HDU83_002017 [Entophlyctis luteolus]|nr:hypothetical protein HDU83_002017 [Entophlyctis luteolus]